MSIQKMYNISKSFSNKKLKKIVNVYQVSYKNEGGNGFGDYLRGSLCLNQICKLLNLEFDMNMENNLIKNFFVKNTSFENITGIDYNNIERYMDDNFSGIKNNKQLTHSEDFFIKYIKMLNSVSSETFYTYSNAFPIIDIIGNSNKQFVWSKISPNEQMKNNVKLRLQKLNLTPKTYSIIHIRCGDTYLVDKSQIDNTFSKNVINVVSQLIKPGHNYLVLSDNNVMKVVLKKKFPNFIVQINNEITHTCNKNTTSQGIMYSLLDFYTMMYANNIIALSVYGHGSGFSKWSSVIHNIPYYFYHLT